MEPFHDQYFKSSNQDEDSDYQQADENQDDDGVFEDDLQQDYGDEIVSQNSVLMESGAHDDLMIIGRQICNPNDSSLLDAAHFLQNEISAISNNASGGDTSVTIIKPRNLNYYQQEFH